MDSVSVDWSSGLPDHIVQLIFSYLDFGDRYRASLTCTGWQETFQQPELWRRYVFTFRDEGDTKQLSCVDNYGEGLKSVAINCDQKEKVNRDNLCQVITRLAHCHKRRLQGLSLHFVGDNPLFFQGGQILSSLAELFGPPAANTELVFTLRSVDLSGLWVAYDDLLFNLLRDTHGKTLETLNILNNTKTCTVTPQCVLALVERCRTLKHLSLFYCSMSEEVVQALAKEDRAALLTLDIMCRREEKYGGHISDEAWRALAQRSPGLRVGLAFDHTCPLYKILRILQPAIPVVSLNLSTFTYLEDHVQAAADHYHPTLERLVVRTKGTPRLQGALVDLARRCLRLRSLRCFCILDRETVDAIRGQRPELHDFVLKTEAEVDPRVWLPVIVGREADLSQFFPTATPQPL